MTEGLLGLPYNDPSGSPQAPHEVSSANIPVGLAVAPPARLASSGVGPETRGPRRVRFQYAMDRTAYVTRKRRLQDPEDPSELDALLPSARLAMVWPLTLQAWAFHTGLSHEPRLRRDIVRVRRGGR